VPRPRDGRDSHDAASARSRDTRQRLLEVRGEVICPKRGSATLTTKRSAAVRTPNRRVHYHFGDKEHLYARSSQYAEQCAAESSPADLAPDAPAEKRLRAQSSHFSSASSTRVNRAWLGKLMAREMSEPTPGLDVIVQEKNPRHLPIREAIVRELLGPGLG